MTNQEWKNIKKEAKTYRTDKNRQLLLAWYGGESHMIHVYDEGGKEVALHNTGLEHRQVPKKEIVSFMNHLINTGGYAWCYDGLEEYYSKK